MVDVAYYRETLNPAPKRGALPFARCLLFLTGTLIGTIMGGWAVSNIHRNDYLMGLEMGRQEQRQITAALSAKKEQIMKKMGLCTYADLACGFYHNPNPVKQRRP